ncbi:hypothetical protein AMAG_07664 [Allomyces macrogynus ATCC 38327]|uniref:Uncharacterized protein n=1 Tax=Allomyces macrogynus (strain ATCC 38327) TaxID=578462 RepID=A0A0L0SIW6_ALLM3|nr:hypothetical protein AMAG_07664 [Allomyces macrogynus ATCC 38327]|eukprot:KNE62448.1 hypothetical protein AMAG_07664 [Allomyces macrogynus ATCC 38327]
MTERVLRAGCGAVHHVVTEGFEQYPKFLAMMVIRLKGTPLVPTSTIDLAWRTHQLALSTYAAQMHALVGYVVNHDDSDYDQTKARIAEAAQVMPTAWRTVVDEDYHHPKVAGVGAAMPETRPRADALRNTSSGTGARRRLAPA